MSAAIIMHHDARIASSVQSDSTAIEGAQSAPDPAPGQRSEVGMRISPEVVLLFGGTLLTVALFAVFIPFFIRMWREDAAATAANKEEQRLFKDRK